MNWKTKETAPKDGTDFLAVTDYGYLTVARWDGDRFRVDDEQTGELSMDFRWAAITDVPEPWRGY